MHSQKQYFCFYQTLILNYFITERFDIQFFFWQNGCKMAITSFLIYIQGIFKLNLCCILMFFGETCNEKRSVIMGVITDKIFIII